MVWLQNAKSPWLEAKQIETRDLLITVATVVTIELVVRVMISHGQYDHMIVIGLARFLEIVSVILIILTWGGGLPSIGLAPERIIYGLQRGFIWSAGFAIISVLFFSLLLFFSFSPWRFIQANLPDKPGAIILFVCVAGILSPVAEEVFFRGVLYGFFRRWGFAWALVLSTAMFVLAHHVVSGIALPQVVGGIAFGVSYEVERTLVVPITFHILGNLAIYVLSLLF